MDRNRPSTRAIAAVLVAVCIGIAVPVNAQVSGEQESSTVLRYAEHRTMQHPSQQVYVNAWPNGLQVTFTNSYGNAATYEFPKDDFPLGDPAYLLTPGSPDLLPLRAVRIADNDYRIEWLPPAPQPELAGATVVRSH